MGTFRGIKIAMITDEFTRSCLAYECRARDVTPLNYCWLFQFWRPDFLFVESAWQDRRNTWTT